MLVVLLFILPFALCNKSIDYLTYYGYLEKNTLTQDITPAIKRFQETFNLEPTGILDNNTLKLMAEPRCGCQDIVRPFSVLPGRRWNNSVITWYQYGPPYESDLIQRAFDVWAKHGNLTFKKDPNNPTIFISFSLQRKHLQLSKSDTCFYDFDGPGGVLGHAFLPNAYYNNTDIHLDSEENWDFSMNLPEYGNTSFFLTMVHEIGHALGLDHSGSNESIMFPFERVPRGITDLYEYDLGKDDILAIQYLYGRPSKPTLTSTSTTTTTTTTTTSKTTSTSTTAPTTTSTTSTTTPSTTIEEKTNETTSNTSTTELKPPELTIERDICEFKNKIDTYVIVNKRIYAIYKEYVWILSLDPSERTVTEYKTARKITDWLHFLPKNFTEISAIYQRPNGDIALFIGTDVYLFRFPALTILAKYSATAIAGRSVHKVNSALSTNAGKTYMFVDDWYLYDINECSFKGSFSGIISSVLYGIPVKVNGAFRYINGMIYFLTNSGVLEYNEFTNTVKRTVSDAFEILQIPCIRETLLTRLYEVIKYLQ